ncbi:Alanine aminotransferase 2 [Acipenser ruthenus]|uniref:alanine transaminase n=1 Tax=Acipenser ruthenus TaxID=7906 RepID=A0A444U3G5_ACIRT|nr:Alanine aminotransferase 2 [Acipenser ruthenus]
MQLYTRADMEPVIMFPAAVSVVVCIALALSRAAAQGEEENVVEKREMSMCQSTCSDGGVSFNGQCYHYYSVTKTWADAELHCLGLGGNLASVHSDDDNQFIQNLIKSNEKKVSLTWLGGSDCFKEMTLPGEAPLALLLLLALLSCVETLKPTPSGSNEVLKAGELEPNKAGILNNLIDNIIQGLEETGQGETAPETTVAPPPAGLCPGNQVLRGGDQSCGCPEGLVLQGENCTCRSGFILQGETLHCQDTDECEVGAEACGPHASCTNTVGSFLCRCQRGFLMGPAGCEDVDECQLAQVTGLQACSEHAVCQNTPGSFSCTCDEGFVLALDGKNCVDVDECTFEEQCRRELGNVCVNAPGSYACSCQTGFRAHQHACVDVDECTESPDICAGKGVCQNSLGSFRCACPLGFRGNGTHCEDDNECASGKHGCDTNARCGNVIGSYFCQCYQGFNGDGHSCFDVDECSLNNGECQHSCTNEAGGYQCHCREGYRLEENSRNCTDVNECVVLNGTCSQICSNTEGSFLCSCRPGFQLHVDQRQCVDIDECKLQNGGCSHGCSNTLGGHSCECPGPLVLDLDNKTCVNITSCSLRNGGCNQVCTERTEGVVECSCKAGWELSSNHRTCQDIDECADFTRGGCEQICENHPGSFNCSCSTGYEGRTDDRTRCQPMCSPPCAHGGTCMRWNTCLCPPGWTGPSCHTAVCELPCSNGGRCIAPETCQCSSDYSGPQCLTPTCTPACLNGGRCVDVNKCICPKGWQGARCQIALIEPCIPPCRHGATCAQFNTCKCPEGTAGQRCEKLTCPIITTTVSTTRAIRQGVRESYVDRCGPLGVHLCTKYRDSVMAAQRKTVTLLEVNPTIRNMKLPAKGVLFSRAAEITQELQQGVPKPFKEVISVDYGDGHAMGMKPITFIRQVRTVTRVDYFMSGTACRGTSSGETGGYPVTPGIFTSQEEPSEPCRQLVLKMLVHSEGHSKTGVLVPVPSYIWFNSAVQEQGGVILPYHLSEEQGWELEIEELQRALRTARGQKCSPRVLYVINPGNPTGILQSRKSIEEVIRFAAEEKLFLMVDEVYQDNVFRDDCEFLSYKKVLFEMGPEYFNSVELTSFNSISKGFAGECGFRCGYLEFVNLDSQVRRYAQQVNSVECCPPTPGQIILDTLMNPPLPGETSYPSFTAVLHPDLDRDTAGCAEQLEEFPSEIHAGVFIALLQPRSLRDILTKKTYHMQHFSITVSS